jgi:glutamate-1-semialdehyde aminotransferase
VSPEQTEAALAHDAVVKIDATLNDGLKAMVAEHRIELKVETIRSTVTSHVAKEDLLFEIFKRTLNTGVTITGALIALLLSIIGYLLVNPIGLY